MDLRGSLSWEVEVILHLLVVLLHEVVGPVDHVEDEERPGEEAAAHAVNGHGVPEVVLGFLGVCSTGLWVLRV